MTTMKRGRKEELEAAALSFLAEAKTPEASGRLRDYGPQRVLARAKAGQGEKAPTAVRRAYRNPALLRHVVVVVMAVLVVMLVSTSGAYAFSYNATPDSPLYGTKIFFERTRVTLTPSSAQDIRLEMRFSERRMEELQAMVSSGNQEGADRWLREYRRNVEGAGVLFETISSQEAEQLSLQFQEMLDQHEHMMQGMRYGQPSGLSGSIEGAYRVCDQEKMRMRRRCGQQEPGNTTQEPGGQQGQGGCPAPDGSSPQEEQPSPTGTMPMDDGTGSDGAGSPANTSSDTPTDAPADSPSETTQPQSSPASESGQVMGGTGYGDEGLRNGHMP